MNIPMWLVVLLVLFSSLGVWCMIFIFKMLGDIMDNVIKNTKKKQNDEHPTV